VKENFLKVCKSESQTNNKLETPQVVSYAILILLVSLVFAGNIFAADMATNFSAANKLYAQGKFSEAADAYEKMLRTGTQSSALLFNYGNAEFKSGHLGKSIVAYQQAEQLSPRDAVLRANLAFVRNQVQGASQRESRWQIRMGALTLNEITLLVTVLFWLTLGLFAMGQIHPLLAPKLHPTTRILAGLTILFATVLGVQAANYYFNNRAVVVADSVIARSGPFEDAQTSFTTRDGAELSVLDRRDGWVQVADGEKSGWLPAKQVEVLPGA
jgi:tetratricopeptide (TPR) repeat protein